MTNLFSIENSSIPAGVAEANCECSTHSVDVAVEKIMHYACKWRQLLQTLPSSEVIIDSSLFALKVMGGAKPGFAETFKEHCANSWTSRNRAMVPRT